MNMLRERRKWNIPTAALKSRRQKKVKIERKQSMNAVNRKQLQTWQYQSNCINNSFKFKLFKYTKGRDHEWVKKTRSNYMLTTGHSLKCKDTCRLKIKGWET